MTAVSDGFEQFIQDNRQSLHDYIEMHGHQNINTFIRF